MSALTRYAVQTRARLDGNTLYGHAAVFGQMAEVPGGYETLARTAFDDVLDRSDTDVVALVEHDPSRLLGRQSAGTLRLKVDDEGLAFEVDLPDTSYARDLRTLVSRGDITGASFGFIPDQSKTKFRMAPGGGTLAEHTRLAMLRDISPVTFPAYKGTAVALRSQEIGRLTSRSRMIRARARAQGVVK